MNTLHETIFQKAMVSQRPEAILEVARAFEASMVPDKACQLYNRVYTLRHQVQVAFGAMARGTPIKGTNGAVIPPGRYWIDLIDDAKRKVWVNWTVDKPEVTIEKTEWSTDADAQHVISTAIFTIPSTTSNYGLPGVFFPTNSLGFPSIADTTIQSKADTVKRPAPMTSMEALAEVPSLLGQGVQSGVQYTAETIGQAAKGVGQGLGLSPTNLIMIGVAALATLVLLNRFMIPVRI
jgi:hypothetical protein